MVCQCLELARVLLPDRSPLSVSQCLNMSASRPPNGPGGFWRARRGVREAVLGGMHVARLRLSRSPASRYSDPISLPVGRRVGLHVVRSYPIRCSYVRTFACVAAPTLPPCSLSRACTVKIFTYLHMSSASLYTSRSVYFPSPFFCSIIARWLVSHMCCILCHSSFRLHRLRSDAR